MHKPSVSALRQQLFLILLISGALPFKTQAQTERLHRTYAIGTQYTLSTAGLQFSAAISPKVSVKALAGIGTANWYGARLQYDLINENALTPYVYAGAGLFSDWAYNTLNDSGKRIYSTGIEAGAGIKCFVRGLPNLGLSAEIGYCRDHFIGLYTGAGIYYFIN